MDNNLADQLTIISNNIYEYCGRNHKKEIYLSHIDIKLKDHYAEGAEGEDFEKNKTLPFIDENGNCLGHYSYDFVFPETKEVVNVVIIDDNQEIMKQVELLYNQIKNIDYNRGYLINFPTSLSYKNREGAKIYIVSKERRPNDLTVV